MQTNPCSNLARRRITNVLPAALLAAILLGSGCSVLPFVGGSDEPTAPAPPPPTLRVQVQGQPKMNSGGHAAVVRIYQLSGQTNFERAPLATFWKNDEQALGNELVSVKEVLLYPEERRSVALEISEKTSHIGIAADLHNPAQERWRAIHPLDERADIRITTTVTADRLHMGVD